MEKQSCPRCGGKLVTLSSRVNDRGQTLLSCECESCATKVTVNADGSWICMMKDKEDDEWF